MASPALHPHLVRAGRAGRAGVELRFALFVDGTLLEVLGTSSETRVSRVGP